MPAFAIAHLQDVQFGEDIVRYLQAVDDTFQPHGGRFRSHGKRPEVLEGDWPGDVVVVEFPNLAAARAWYHSAAYQAILPLRLRHSRGDVILLDGVPDGYRATELLRTPDQTDSSPRKPRTA